MTRSTHASPTPGERRDGRLGTAWRTAEGRLVRALLRRELAPARLAPAALLAAAAAWLLARQLAGLTLPDTVDAPLAAAEGGFGAYLLEHVGRMLALPAAAAAAALGVLRVAGDHEAGWLPALVAAGPPRVRATYLLAMVGAVALAAALLAAVATAAFALASGAGAAAALGRATVALPGGVPLALSAAAYGVGWGALARRRGAAAAGAAAGLLVPVLAAAAVRVLTGSAAPPIVARLLSAALPPLVWDADPVSLARHALYLAAVLVPLTLLAPRLVARAR